MNASHILVGYAFEEIRVHPHNGKGNVMNSKIAKEEKRKEKQTKRKFLMQFISEHF